MTRALRFLVSAGVALVGVFAVLAAVLSYFREPPRVEQAMAEELLTGVEVIDLDKDPRLKELLAREGMVVAESQKKPEPPPKVELPERMVQGFVQLEFTVDEEGIVKDARVIGAVPKGYYEAEALAAIGRKVYMPEYRDGEPVASQRTEVIQFEVPAKRR